MAIAEQTLQTLEFPKIREQLARHVGFSASRELALNLDPSVDPVEVRRRLAFTAETRTLLDEYPDTTIGGARDIRRAARHAERGGVLDGASLLEIAATLGAIRQLRARLIRLDGVRFPLLIEQATFLPLVQNLEDAILRAIGEDGAVLDNASPELSRLRREIKIAFARVQEKLQSILAANTSSGALQEAIITVRNGRYVVPVKASHRRNMRGLVHDQSSSGATLYIEPMAVVELNNRWRELQSAEEEEVARILAALSDLVGTQSANLVGAVETLAEIDLAIAKARYAEALRCTNPQMTAWSPDHTPGAWQTDLPATQPATAPGDPTAPLFVPNARHPLLDQRTVVPTTVWLGGDFRLLLITGPNTGGKTVALKRPACSH